MPTATAQNLLLHHAREEHARQLQINTTNTTVETKLNGDPIVTETVKEEVKVDVKRRINRVKWS